MEVFTDRHTTLTIAVRLVEKGGSTARTKWNGRLSDHNHKSIIKSAQRRAIFSTLTPGESNLSYVLGPLAEDAATRTEMVKENNSQRESCGNPDTINVLSSSESRISVQRKEVKLA